VERRSPPAFLVFVSGLLLPGLGHILIGRRGKGLFFFFILVGTFVFGLWLGGFRNVYVGPRRWSTLAQVPVGAPAFAAIYLDRLANRENGEAGRKELIKRIEPRYSLGTLYTSVAGLLNLIVALDAVRRSMKIQGA